MMTDRAFGIVAAILSFLFLAVAVPSITGDWQRGADARYFTVGPRFFPYIAGSLTLLFAVLLAIYPSNKGSNGALHDRAARNNVLLAMAITLAYVILLGVLGFTLTSVLALATFLIGYGERRWYFVAPIAVLMPVAIRYMFFRGFALELPLGYLGIPF